jgi:hypothetical protein
VIELYADCDRCLVQGAVIEVFDPEGGVAVEAACGLCGVRRVSGEVVEVGIDIGDAGAVRASLESWAVREGYGTAAELIGANFLLEDEAALLRALAEGAAVETSFDVTGFLFGSSAGGAADGVPLEAARAEGPDTPSPPAQIMLPEPPGFDVKNAVLALASVMAADGEHTATEWAYVRGFGKERGVELQAHEVRVYRPDEVGDVGGLVEREQLIEHMVELAMADGESDESELRVVETFARAWGVDPLRIHRALARYGQKHQSAFARLWKKVVLFLFPAPA